MATNVSACKGIPQGHCNGPLDAMEAVGHEVNPCNWLDCSPFWPTSSLKKENISEEKGRREGYPKTPSISLVLCNQWMLRVRHKTLTNHRERFMYPEHDPRHYGRIGDCL